MELVLKEALERLSPERQRELADVLQQLADTPTLSCEQKGAIDEGIAQADAGDFASDEEVAALFARYRDV
jgi:predicted transcriptional regulator